MPGHPLAEAVGGCVEPGRFELRAQLLLAPARLFAVEKLRQFDRLAEVHRHLAEALLEGADDLENVEDRFLLLARSRSEEHTSELQSLMRISYAVFCLKKTKCTYLNTQ